LKVEEWKFLRIQTDIDGLDSGCEESRELGGLDTISQSE
jgi:hypothetical protein